MIEPIPGVRTCLSCGFLFVSPDLEHVRRCADCKRDEDTYPLRSGRIAADIVAVVLARESPQP